MRSSAPDALKQDALKPIQGVIFDLDGVVVDSEPLHRQAFMEVFEELGYGDSHGLNFEDYLGGTDRAVWEDFIARHDPPESLENLMRRKQKRLIRRIETKRPLFQPIPALLHVLAQKYSLAVASGSLHAVINAVLELDGLRSYFPVVVSSEDVPRGKPAPDIFLEAADRMGLPPGAICVIEDSAAGVASGKAAGMQVIAITNSLPYEKVSHADFVVSEYEQVRRLLLDPLEAT